MLFWFAMGFCRIVTAVATDVLLFCGDELLLQGEGFFFWGKCGGLYSPGFGWSFWAEDFSVGAMQRSEDVFDFALAQIVWFQDDIGLYFGFPLHLTLLSRGRV